MGEVGAISITRGTSAIALCAFAFACTPTGALTRLDVDGIDDRLALPSGELEETDALGLAYLIINTREVLEAIAPAAAELPGMNRSPLFDQSDVVQCRKDDDSGYEIDYDCLPEDRSGALRVDPERGFANENGDYRIELKNISVKDGVTVEADALMRVEGVANPTKVEKTIFAPVGFVRGMPPTFDAVEQTAIVVDNTRGKEKLSCLTMVLDQTYAWSVTDSKRDGELGYSIRDKRNIWDCTSQVDGTTIVSSECRTPIGQGDFAVLRF